ncbi:MAG: hypothetical protein IPN29_20705 [Saprospiraceae bacterium]|nr:hypothetical protein [Saprospiraceae bacterium]
MAKKSQVKAAQPANKPTKTEVLTYPKADVFWVNHWWKILLIFAACFILYHKTASFGYVLDDQIVITDNTFTKKGFGGIYELLTTESMTGYFNAQKNLVEGNRYRPLSLITFAMEYGIFNELRPGFSHIINILLYALSCVFIMRVIQLLVPDKKPVFGFLDMGLAVALLFLVHPIHVEAVANIKGRDEVMALLFSVASLLFLIQYYMYGQSQVYKYLGLICYLLGLLSKENTITFLAVIPMSIWAFGGQHSGKAWRSLAWLSLISFIYLMLRFNVAGVPEIGQKITDIMNNPFLEMNAGEKLATILYTLGLYVKLLFIPWPLTHDYYPYAIPIMNWGMWKVWLSFLLYAAMVYWGYKTLKQKQVSGYAIWYYLITLTIVSNVVINLGTFMNDRFIYMPSLGFCLLLVWAIWFYGEKIKNVSYDVVRLGFLSVPLLTFGALSLLRVPDWETALSLNQSAMRVSENSARANSFMATALFNEYKESKDDTERARLLDEAMPYAKKAADIIPEYFNANLMVAGVAGEQYSMNKNLDQLLASFEQVIYRRPDVPFLTEYLQYLNRLMPDMNKLTAFYIKVGKKLMSENNIDQYKWAAHFMKLGLEVNPADKTLNQLTGECFNALGDRNQAAQYLTRAAGLQ